MITDKSISPKARARMIAAGLVRPLLARMYQYKNTGERTLIDPSVHVLGWRHVTVGDRSVVSQDCWLNTNLRGVPGMQIIIGADCFIGRRSVISPGRLIEIGRYCLTGYGCSFLGSDHIFDDPMKPYVSTGNTTKSVMKIGANCWFGQGVTVLGEIVVGHGSVIGSGAVVTRDVPPFSVVVGSPGRVVKRYSFVRNSWVAVGDADPSEFDGPAEAEYLALLERDYPRPLLPRPAAGRRMGNTP